MFPGVGLWMGFQGCLCRRIRTLLRKNMREISLCESKRSPSPVHPHLRSINKGVLCHLSEFCVITLPLASGMCFFLSLPTLPREVPVS